MRAPDGTRASAGARDRPSLWTAAASAALLAVGFRRRRGAIRSGPRPDGMPGRDGAEHGRLAATPSEIPARGWKDILWRVYEKIADDRVLAISAGVAFYVLLSIFPGIGALVALYGLFADPATIAGHVDAIGDVAPGGTADLIKDQIARISAQGNRTLGVAFVVGLAISLWSANSGIKALFDALNIVYSEKEKRGFFSLNAVSLTFTVGAVLFLLVALTGVVVLPIVLNFVGIGSSTDWLVRLARWPVLFVVVGLALAVIYRHGPSREKPQWRWITWGSATAAVAWVATSVLFSWYVASFGSYNKTYGSLGAVIAFMTWIWLSVIIVLMGAELDAEMEHQTARDTTTGGGKPFGSRGARMADTIGEARS